MSPSISSNAGSCGSPESGICMDTCVSSSFHMLPGYDEHKEVTFNSSNAASRSPPDWLPQCRGLYCRVGGVYGSEDKRTAGSATVDPRYSALP